MERNHEQTACPEPESLRYFSHDNIMGEYKEGDYVKVEFPDEATGIGEWMWLRVARRDDKKQIVYGTLDNEPVGDYGGEVKLGSELAVSYAQIRDHKSRRSSRRTRLDRRFQFAIVRRQCKE